MNTETAYRLAPRWTQTWALNAFALVNERARYGGGYRRIEGEVTSRDSWSQTAMLSFQERRLLQVAQLAERTGHWGTVFKSLGISAREAAQPEVYAALPTVSKAEMVADPKAFQLPAEGVTWAHTSGTTGAGFRFTTTRTALQEQWAVWWRYRSRLGIERGLWCGYFGGRAVVPVRRTKAPFWQVNYPARQVLFSNYHMHEQGLAAMAQELRRRRLPWLHGYPSSVSLLANYLRQTDFDLGYQPLAITTGAESLLEPQRAAIRDAFGVAPFQHYGCTEAVANASQCAAGRLHLDDDFSRVDVSNAGTVVGTGFSNESTIFFRYLLTDGLSISERACDCGLPGRMVGSLEGRVEDYLVLSDGSRVGRIDHIFKDLTFITEAQVVQEQAGRAKVLVVPREPWTSVEENRLRSAFLSFFGHLLQVEVELVDRVPRTSAGKLRLVRSEAADHAPPPA